MEQRTAARVQGVVGRIAAVVAVLFALAAVPAAHPRAATITVNSTADTVADDGECTLREAITAANNNVSFSATPGECAAGSSGTPDTISFTAAVTGTITLVSAQLPIIEQSVTITGPGAAVLAVQRNAVNAVRFRIFRINTSSPVTISGLTISGGNVGDTESADSGGGINSNTAGNNLTLDSVVLTGNAANGESSGGGGIFATGTLTVRNSTISDNTASGDTGGGGIRYSSSNGTLTIENSTLSGNIAK